MLNVALVHYHLSLGGVSRVMMNQSHALSAAGVPHVLLIGPTEQVPFDIPHRVIKGLAYQMGNECENTAETTWLEMKEAVLECFSELPDVWHFHNHALGKSRVVTELVSLMAGLGFKLLLHMHDWVEDGRIQQARLIQGLSKRYPKASHVHYAFINTWDMRRMRRLGLPESQAHWLPNGSSLTKVSCLSTPESALLLYPVRGIRRKNLGEVLLWSLMLPVGARIAMTQAPTQVEWLGIYEQWKSVAAYGGLPIDFEVVGRCAPRGSTDASFHSWLAHATHFISTSISEGFGMIFADAVAMHKPLLARDIRILSEDQDRLGIHASDGYDQILIPRAWVNVEELRVRICDARSKWIEAWGMEADEMSPDDLIAHWGNESHLDFGCLPELMQQRVIVRLIKHPETISEVRVLGGQKLEDGFRDEVSAETWLHQALGRNKKMTDRGLTKSTCVSPADLLDVYDRVSQSTVGDVDAFACRELIQEAMRVPSFHLLQSPSIETLPEADMQVYLSFKAIIFDVYGTLRIAAAGGVKRDLLFDPVLSHRLKQMGFSLSGSPTTELYQAVMNEHRVSEACYPEVDLREIWKRLLGLSDDISFDDEFCQIESLWHPSSWMPGAENLIQTLHQHGIRLGLLSNAQANTIPSFGGVANCFENELTILSYEERVAKPSICLFEKMRERLALMGIQANETLLIGNDPLHDILPAKQVGFSTALFIGHPESIRPGYVLPDWVIREYE